MVRRRNRRLHLAKWSHKLPFVAVHLRTVAEPFVREDVKCRGHSSFRQTCRAHRPFEADLRLYLERALANDRRFVA